MFNIPIYDFLISDKNVTCQNKNGYEYYPTVETLELIRMKLKKSPVFNGFYEYVGKCKFVDLKNVIPTV